MSLCVDSQTVRADAHCMRQKYLLRGPSEEALALLLHDFGCVMENICARMGDAHYEAAKGRRAHGRDSKLGRLATSDFADNVILLEHARDILTAAIADELLVANRYATWQELADSIGNTSKQAVWGKANRPGQESMRKAFKRLLDHPRNYLVPDWGVIRNRWLPYQPDLWDDHDFLDDYEL